MKFKTKRAGNRRGFDQADRHAIAEPVRFSAALGPQQMPVLVVAKIFVPDGARRNKAIGAGLVELDEQAGTRDPRDVTFERCADPIGQEMREQAIERFALRLHGAPLGRRDLRGNLAQAGEILLLR